MVAPATRIAIFPPISLTDAIDGAACGPGGMSVMQNLIPHPTTKNMVTCRPGAQTLIALATAFTAPTYVSCLMVQGLRIWGMASTGRNAGKDEPFCYELATSAFVTISGVTSGNSPTSPATSGAWNPPKMIAIADKIVITHPGYNGSGSNFFGYITGSTGGSPAYTASNTATNVLPSVPTSVESFGSRAWFVCGNTVFYSDVLAPATMTNASQSLVFGGGDVVTALGPQPFYTTQTGGIIQSLLVFKATQVYQVTGDAALSTLAQNKVSDGIGTSAPRTVVNTPVGCLFMAPDGLRSIDLQGNVSSRLPDLNQPLLYCTVPSRAAAAYSVGTYRINVTYQLPARTVVNADFWYDVGRQLWTGPHSTPYDGAAGIGTGFILAGAAIGGQILASASTPGVGDNFTELGATLTWKLQTAPVTDTNPFETVSVLHTTLSAKFVGGTTITGAVLDRDFSVLDSTIVQSPLLPPAGISTWLLTWDKPVLTQTRHSFVLSGQSTQGLALGNLSVRYNMRDVLDVEPSNALVVQISFGSTADSNITIYSDWGMVSEAVAATFDFGNVTDPVVLSGIDYGPVPQAVDTALDYGLATDAVTSFVDYGYVNG